MGCITQGRLTRQGNTGLVQLYSVYLYNTCRSASEETQQQVVYEEVDTTKLVKKECIWFKIHFCLRRIGAGETLELKVNEAYGPVSTIRQC